MAKQNKKHNELFLKDFGKEVITESFFHPIKLCIMDKKVVELSDDRLLFEAIVNKCYHGGRNECYGFGPSPVHEINDFDIKAAYTTAMVDIRPLDYSRAFKTEVVTAFMGDVCGFAKVNFMFPDTLRYPCLPVRTEKHGLYYPLSGTTYCTAPELALAVELGGHISIEIGIIVPWATGDRRIFEPFVQSVRQKRASHKKAGRKFEEQLWKEIGNSLYGKTAQGLKKKSGFDPRTGGSKTTQCSDISNPYYAAHITGQIRTLLSELIAKTPADRQVYSATTDGFLTDATMDDLDCSGALARRFRDLALRLDGISVDEAVLTDDKTGQLILERKHRVMQVILMRTRGQLTGIPYPDETEVLLAKCSVKPPMRDKFEQNAYMLDLFINRTPGQLLTQEHIISMRQQWRDEADLITISREVKLGLEFDFKRKPVNLRTEKLGDIEHLAFDTVPWATADEGLQVRTYFDTWRKTHCLKTLADYEDWEEFYITHTMNKGKGVKITAEGLVGVLRRKFLFAYTNELWNCKKNMTLKQVATWLTGAGYPTNESGVKNGTRAKLEATRLPPTPRVLALWRVLLEKQPDLDLAGFFMADQMEVITQQLQIDQLMTVRQGEIND